MQLNWLLLLIIMLYFQKLSSDLSALLFQYTGRKPRKNLTFNSYIENLSFSSYIENLSFSSYIENLSFSSYIES